MLLMYLDCNIFKSRFETGNDKWSQQIGFLSTVWPLMSFLLSFLLLKALSSTSVCFLLIDYGLFTEVVRVDASLGSY